MFGSWKAEPGWFCVWGVVAIQIEGQGNGTVDLEDRLVLVVTNRRSLELSTRRGHRRESGTLACTPHLPA